MSMQQLWIWPFTHYKPTNQVMVSRKPYVKVPHGTKCGTKFDSKNVCAYVIFL